METITTLASHIKHVFSIFDWKNHLYGDKKSYSPWQELPDELMEIILQHTDITDRFNMSMVCTYWESILKHGKNQVRIPPQFPWLLLPHALLRCGKQLSFYDMSHAKLSHFKVPRLIQGARCCASSKGWLIMLKEDRVAMKSQIIFFNPVSGTTHKLPSLKSVVDHSLDEVNDFVGSIQLSCENPTNCIVASYIESKPDKLVFCKVGSQNWSIYSDFIENLCLTQILFSKDGKTLYVLKSVDEGEPMSVTTSCFKSIDYQLTLKIIPISFTYPIFNEMTQDERVDDLTVIARCMSLPNLVESNNGEILLIRRVVDAFLTQEEDFQIEEEEAVLKYMHVKGFEIYKLLIDVDKGTTKITKLTNLDNQILFFSSSGLSLVEARNFPEFQGNCVYFLEDYLNTCQELYSEIAHVSRESGIYHIEDGRVDRCFPSVELPVRSHMGWFHPNSF